MLSVKLSKILSEKNVPHEGEWWSFVSCGDGCPNPEHRRGRWMLTEKKESHDAIPAYPEIALFKYAKVLWTGRDHCAECGVVGNMHYIETDHRGFKTDSQHHTHALADLFSSGASEQEIEDYVLSSIEGK